MTWNNAAQTTRDRVVSGPEWRSVGRGSPRAGVVSVESRRLIGWAVTLMGVAAMVGGATLVVSSLP